MCLTPRFSSQLHDRWPIPTVAWYPGWRKWVHERHGLHLRCNKPKIRCFLVGRKKVCWCLLYIVFFFKRGGTPCYQTGSIDSDSERIFYIAYQRVPSADSQHLVIEPKNFCRLKWPESGRNRVGLYLNEVWNGYCDSSSPSTTLALVEKPHLAQNVSAQNSQPTKGQMPKQAAWSAFKCQSGTCIGPFFWRISIREARAAIPFPNGHSIKSLIQTPRAIRVHIYWGIVRDMIWWGKCGLQSQLHFSRPRWSPMPKTCVEQHKIPWFHPIFHDHVFIQFNARKQWDSDVWIPQKMPLKSTFFSVHWFACQVLFPLFSGHGCSILALIDDLCATHTTLWNQIKWQSRQCCRNVPRGLIPRLAFASINMPSKGRILMPLADEISLYLSGWGQMGCDRLRTLKYLCRDAP